MGRRGLERLPLSLLAIVIITTRLMVFTDWEVGQVRYNPHLSPRSHPATPQASLLARPYTHR